jgi:hypothetical protein
MDCTAPTHAQTISRVVRRLLSAVGDSPPANALGGLGEVDRKLLNSCRNLRNAVDSKRGFMHRQSRRWSRGRLGLPANQAASHRSPPSLQTPFDRVMLTRNKYCKTTPASSPAQRSAPSLALFWTVVSTTTATAVTALNARQKQASLLWVSAVPIAAAYPRTLLP